MATTLKSGNVLLVLSITGQYDPVSRAAEAAGRLDARSIPRCRTKPPAVAGDRGPGWAGQDPWIGLATMGQISRFIFR